MKVGPVHIGPDAPNSSPASTAATALVTGTVYQILTVGTTDFTLVGASANTVGVIFTATGAGTGDGTVSGQQGVEKGEQWLDTTGGTYVLKIYDGTAWRSESGTFVDVNGDTMTGALLLDNAASAAAPDLSFDGDADTGIYSPAADEFGIATAGTAAITVDSSQNVGFGTTSPNSRVVISESGQDGIEFIPQQTTATNQVLHYNRNTSAYSIVDTRAAQHIFRVGGSEAARIDSSGRLLLGLTSQSGSNRFTIQGNSGNNAGPAYFACRRGAASPIAGQGLGYFRFENSDGDLGAQIRAQATADWSTANEEYPTALCFHTRAASDTSTVERMRIDSSGRLLVGMSSSTNNTRAVFAGNSASSTGAGVVQIARGQTFTANDTNVGNLEFTDLSGNLFGRINCTSDATVTAGSDHPGRLVFSTTADGASSPTERLRINRVGSIRAQQIYDETTASASNVFVTSNGTLQRSTSSAKYKTNIETLESSYSDALLGCRPVWYRSTCESDNPEHGWWGFIAEEVAEIDPRLVHWKTTETTYDSEGFAVDTPCDPEPEGVAYDRFVPHLLNLIKRQQQAIETLEAKVAALEAG